VLGTAQGLLCAVAGRPAPIKARTEAGQDLGHVPDQIVIDLACVDHHETPAGCRQGCFDQLGVHTSEAVAVFDHYRRHLRVCKRRRSLEREPFMPEPTSASTRTTG
jgi:hypothetical protein